MMYGIERKDLDLIIGVDRLPGRKKLCLVIKEGCAETKLASFNNEESAALFMGELARMVGLKEKGA